MAVPGTSGNPRKSRTFFIVVAVLWVAALGAAGLMIWFWQTGAFTAPTTTTLPPTTTTEAPTTTTELPTTTEPPTTTTTLPPALTVSAGGDVMGDRKVGTFLDENGGAAAFAGVKPYFEGSHLGFVNLEGAISDAGVRNAVKEYTFRSRPALLDGLTSAGIDIVSLANNHSLDYRWKALSDCIARLDAASIKHAGAGGDSTEASAAAMLDTPAGKVAVIAASEITASFAATSSRAGTYYISSSSSHNEALMAKVAEAAAQADFVIVSLHWGVEYKTVANSQQIGLAHALIDAGADLILGHHPHVVQGMEIYKDRLIVYSMGDFVFDHYSRITGEAFVLQVSLPRDGTAPWGTIIPVYLSDAHGIPAVVTGNEAKRILDRMIRLSAKRGLELKQDGDIATFGTPPATDSGVDTSGSSTTTSASGTTTTSAPTTTTRVTTP
jgi:poly-gamma-glutamate capsule biosynthesis protein CapA/YwtB (metallophosphatase superfamily)